ncbi:tubulin/FtsZ family protein [Methanogenium sp. S4BF]|uniref:tubulin/FtsZ family protein n=1 Tax=Methanogenium sp. S4BF TaxID=1789226 RepID=UPI0024175C35|nr:tubulin/FtsZ family protein [Methanogenium sp. S4BF]WFN33569.1 tubulin/FtsZ family protein [Methanogenium sp. S4BF]
MRILAIGLGGAGTRIVDLLYSHDMKSRVGCVSAIAVDMDGNSLRQLSHVPDNARMHFPAIDPEIHFDVASTINIEEVITLIQKMDHFEIDSIMIFAGLGGSVIDAIPQLTEELRKSYIEPIFGVCVLPMRNEGKRRSSKAADDIERIQSVLDAIILFDNETWHERLKAEYSEYSVDRDTTGISGYRRKAFPDNPRDIYAILNEKIARQMGLLLRAGEFSETGVEAAEIVLDAGEVLNTLKGNDLVAIGYATEPLQNSFIDRFNQWRSDTYFSETSHKRATRIVTLAKRAVYEEISIPCDITSAEKALVLIAGPSQELSMKGFQTVRKWIDRSISGLEMRSGDYPVMNTRFVGIIIVLAGITNIPRVTELIEIRREYLDDQEHAVEEERFKKQLEEQFTLQEKETASWKEAEAALSPVPVQPEGGTGDEGETDLDITDLFEDETADDHTFIRDREAEPEWKDNTTPAWQEEEQPHTWQEEEEYPSEPSSERGEYLQAQTGREMTMAAEDGRQVLNDGMITLGGVARSEKRKGQGKDDQISLGMKSEKKGIDTKVPMPARQERTVADMTRMTSGGENQAPKDTIFGLKDIPSSSSKGPRDTALVGETISIGKQDKRPNDTSFGGKEISVSFVKGPNDSAYMGRSVSVSSSPKANDSALMGKSISVRSSGIRPNDSTFTGDSVRLSRGAPRTKEILNGDVKMSARTPAPKDDLLTRAERRMSRTQEAAKEPEKEPSYKKGTISGAYEKKTEPEEDDTGDDLFWIK